VAESDPQIPPDQSLLLDVESEPPPRRQRRRGHWSSRLGFILAAAGSAIGLGNIWKFPYIAGANGGGWFVLIYLLCIVGIGLPIMIAEVMLGRRAQRSPVEAFAVVAGERTVWRMVGWMGVVAGFIILSYYSVVAGWTMNYSLMAVTRFFSGKSPEEISGAFGTLYASGDINLFWHFVFMLTAVGIVLGGVRQGIESWSKVLMPVLFALLVVLLIDSMFMPGFMPAVEFLFAPNAERLTPAGILEALGHSFFTLSIGMGAMLTYGSYLPRDRDIVGSSAAVSILDTTVALMACLILFPVIFSFGMEPEAGPGLVFKSMPVALSKMTGGTVLAIIFFVSLFVAALTSAISLLEVVVSTTIDQLGWTRRTAALVMGGLIFVFGIPSALSGSGGVFKSWEALFGKNFFDTFDYLASNWLLPLGGLLIAIFVGWVMPNSARREEFVRGSRWGKFYPVYSFMLRFVVPIAIGLLWLFSVEILPKTWLTP
jgi:NSS family neurotransmitter:Na+ symporter